MVLSLAWRGLRRCFDDRGCQNAMRPRHGIASSQAMRGSPTTRIQCESWCYSFRRLRMRNGRVIVTMAVSVMLAATAPAAFAAAGDGALVKRGQDRFANPRGGG